VDGYRVNQAGARLAASSWFETGLMDPSPDSSAWGGARWIGGGDEDLVLYAPYLAIFDVKYAVTIASGSARASFVYGANDSRLMDKNKNIYGSRAAKIRATSSWNLTSPRSTVRRTAGRSFMSTAPATRTPIRLRSRCGLSTSRPT